MSVLLPEVQQAGVIRLLRQYFNQLEFNCEMYDNGDISMDELFQLSMVVDMMYASLIVSSVLE